MSDEMRQRLQLVVSELQNVAQQVASVDGQIKELEGTKELLSTQEAGRAVYRQSGPLLLEVADRETLLEDIHKSVVTLQGHLKALTEMESELRTQYDAIVNQFEGSQ